MPHEPLTILLPYPLASDTVSVAELPLDPEPALYAGWAAACNAHGWPATRCSALVIWVPATGATRVGLGLSSAHSLSDRVPRLPDLFALPPGKMRWQTHRAPLGGAAFGTWVPWALWTRSGVLGLLAGEASALVPPPVPARAVQWHRGTSRLIGGHSA